MKEIYLKNLTYHFFNDMINLKNFEPSNIKIDEKSFKNTLIYYIRYVTPNSVNPLYLIISQINGYIKENKRNGNKYLTLVLTDESKNTLKKYEELWNKIRDLIWSTTSNSENYNEILKSPRILCHSKHVSKRTYDAMGFSCFFLFTILFKIKTRN